MGDKITKAFQNVDDILTDMGLNTTNQIKRFEFLDIIVWNTLDNINALKQQIKQ